MKILMTHIMNAKNPDTGRHNTPQREWAAKVTGADEEVAIAALYHMDIKAPKWQEFYLLRTEAVYDTKANKRRRAV